MPFSQEGMFVPPVKKELDQPGSSRKMSIKSFFGDGRYTHNRGIEATVTLRNK
jgi:hypothetical protein